MATRPPPRIKLQEALVQPSFVQYQQQQQQQQQYSPARSQQQQYSPARLQQQQYSPQKPPAAGGGGMTEFERDVMEEMIKLEASFQRALKGESSSDAANTASSSSAMVSNIPAVPPQNQKSSYHVNDNDNDNNRSTYSNNRDLDLSDIQAVDSSRHHPRQQVSSSTADRARIKGSGIMNLYKNPYDNSSDVKAANQKMEYALQLQHQIEEKKQLKINELKTYIEGAGSIHGGGRLSSQQQGYPSLTLASVPSSVEIVDQTFSPGFDASKLPPPSSSLLHDMYGYSLPFLDAAAADSRGGFVLGKEEAVEKAMRRERQEAYRRQLDEMSAANNAAAKASNATNSDYNYSNLSSSSSQGSAQPMQHPSRQTINSDNEKVLRRRQQEEYRRTLDAQLADKKSSASKSDSAGKTGPAQPRDGDHSTHAVPPPLRLREDFNYESQFQQQLLQNQQQLQQQQQSHGGHGHASSYPPALHMPLGGASGLSDSPPRGYQAAHSAASNNVNAKSPTKARIRLINDVYGSADMLGHDATVMKDSWRPSMGQSDDRRKASMTEQRQVLEDQIADTRRRKEEESQRLKRIDEEEERRVRAELAELGDEEQAAKNSRRQRVHEETNAMRVLQEKRTEEANARRNVARSGGGVGVVLSSPQRTTPVKRAPHVVPSPQQVPPSPAGASAAGNVSSHGSYSRPPYAPHAASAAHNTSNVSPYDVSGYQHSSSGLGRHQRDNDTYANVYEEPRRSYEYSYGDANVSTYMSSRDTSSSMVNPYMLNHHANPPYNLSSQPLYRARPGSADQADSFLDDWQRRVAAPNHVVATDLSMSMNSSMLQTMNMQQQQQQTDARMAMHRRSLGSLPDLSSSVNNVSFVSDSRLVSANPYDSFGLLASMQQPQLRSSRDADTFVSQNNTSARARSNYDADILEQSLASDSLLTFIGGTTTPNVTPKVMRQQMTPLAEHDAAAPIGSPLSKLMKQSSMPASSVKAAAVAGSSNDSIDGISFSRPVDTRDSIDSMIANRPLSTKKSSSSSNAVTSSTAYSIDEDHEEELHIVRDTVHRISPSKGLASPYVSQTMQSLATKSTGALASAEYDNDNFDDDETGLDWKDV